MLTSSNATPRSLSFAVQAAAPEIRRGRPRTRWPRNEARRVAPSSGGLGDELRRLLCLQHGHRRRAISAARRAPTVQLDQLEAVARGSLFRFVPGQAARVERPWPQNRHKPAGEKSCSPGCSAPRCGGAGGGRRTSTSSIAPRDFLLARGDLAGARIWAAIQRACARSSKKPRSAPPPLLAEEECHALAGPGRAGAAGALPGDAEWCSAASFALAFLLLPLGGEDHVQPPREALRQWGERPELVLVVYLSATMAGASAGR